MLADQLERPRAHGPARRTDAAARGVDVEEEMLGGGGRPRVSPRRHHMEYVQTLLIAAEQLGRHGHVVAGAELADVA